ncbi:P-loop containing nucleoside triphosphate hydrolase protein [Diplogelasinospora grovesii]|uniref:P-loop containing nucleoside triphosphate hydrolase protein n=1 Tax=Diplogelasinospora grovesii TaxID=303347 RepID=A0AAN6MXC7_9PEZI|nr:P-loop containing nucleoside triphosphate hydrolase protein [Diplogelasinospora grovesii]
MHEESLCSPSDVHTSLSAQKGTEEYSLVLLGDSGVGKTAIVSRILGKDFQEHTRPTVEDLWQIDLKIEEQRCKLKLLDTNGEEAVAKAAIWTENQDGILLVYSVTSRKSFEVIKTLYAKITRNGTIRPPLVILVANKDDCEEGRQVSQRDLLTLAVDLKCPLVETSAKREDATGGVRHLVKHLRRQRRNRDDLRPASN